MSKSKYQELTDLKVGKFDSKIKVRILRIWRALTKTGDVFKGFNIMLLDNKNNRIHPFVPGICADDLEYKLIAGKICIIRNFTVQEYKIEDKFRCLRKDVQLILSSETQIKEVQDDGRTIAQNAFDLCDHSELKTMAKQNTYLADVVGIIKFRETLFDLVNRHGNAQKQSKFTLTDGRSNVKVTFWDAFALKFERQLLEAKEHPIILIISSCRVGVWNDEVDLGNVAATECFVNYNHHSVSMLRKMLTNPAFCAQIFSTEKQKKLDLMTVSGLTNLGAEYIQTEVLAHLSIRYVEGTGTWFSNVCTTCNKDVQCQPEFWFCDRCNCPKPYPEKKYKLSVVASDKTGAIEVILGDQQVRAIVKKRVSQIIKEVGGDESFPVELKRLEKEKYTMKLMIKEVNIVNKIHVYSATNICNDFVLPDVEPQLSNMQESIIQASNSSYHLDGISQLNFTSPASTKTTEEN